MKKALIVGASGQDGTLLAQLLASRGIEHLGLNRLGLIDAQGALIHPGNLTDPEFIEHVIKTCAPTHVYYLAAHHHSSQDIGLKGIDLWHESLRVQVMGLVNFLEAIRLHAGTARLFYASSAHIFGSTSISPQNETTPRVPNNVYAITKVTGMEACRHYRDEHGLFASAGILYNHESAYRKPKFLSQKIILGARAIKDGRAQELILGDLSSKVDWGYAPDYVDAMDRIMDLPHPGEYVIATGETHTVREFVELAFTEQGLDYRKWVRENPAMIRKSEGFLVGDSTKLRRDTGWSPSLSFSAMIPRLAEDTRRLAWSPRNSLNK